MPKILVATAGSLPALENVRFVTRLAERLNAQVVLLHVGVPDSAEGKKAISILEDGCKRVGVETKSVLHSGDLVETIVDVADEHNVTFILMGVSGRTEISRWISADVRLATHVPVLVIPQSSDLGLDGGQEAT